MMGCEKVLEILVHLSICFLTIYIPVSYIMILVALRHINFGSRREVIICVLLAPVTFPIWLYGEELRKLFGKGETNEK